MDQEEPLTARTASRRNRRVSAVVAGLVSSVMVLTGCGYEDLDQYDLAQDGEGVAGGSACDEYADYGSFDDATVSVFSSIRDAEAERFAKSFIQFEECTGIKIRWDGTGDFENRLQERLAAKKAPDLAAVTQPGLVTELARRKTLVRPGSDVVDQVTSRFSPEWVRYGTVDEVFYALPLGVNVKSLVWYSPDMFHEHGWKVPRTWAELEQLTERIAGVDGIKPWCAGMLQTPTGGTSGWPGTDWVEDVMLRTAGAAYYDAWVDHRIPFTHPKVVDAFTETGEFLRNPEYTNGGFGDVTSINTTTWMEAGTPILDGKCAMHRAASTYSDEWPENARVGEDGDVYAFYLPARGGRFRPVLGGGEFLVAFNSRPETRAVQRYLVSDEWIGLKVEAGHWISPSKGLNTESVEHPIDKLSLKILQDPKTVFRLDASDRMPTAVGSKSFRKGMLEWFDGRSTRSVLDRIESSWPR